MKRTTHTRPHKDKLFETIKISETIEELAPDGSCVRPLLSLVSGGMAQFEIQAGRISKAVVHRSVEELWFVISGHGEIWRRRDCQEHVDVLAEGVCVSIPEATAFQFRCIGDAPLRIAAVTMPPWPGPDEAKYVEGKWS